MNNFIRRNFRSVSYSIATLAFLAVAAFTDISLGHSLPFLFCIGACAELNQFRFATEFLTNNIRLNPRLGRRNFWRNMIPSGSYETGKGTTASTFTVKTSEPQDSMDNYTTDTISGGALSGACASTYEDINVGFYERTYSPKVRRFRGPVICKEYLTYAHAAEEFVNKYDDEMQGYIARAVEFSIRREYVALVPHFVDVGGTITRYDGPNAIASVPRPYQGASYDSLQAVATSLTLTGAGAVENGYVNHGSGGPIYPVEIDMTTSANILRANSTIAEYAKFASMGKDGEGNTSLFSPIMASRVIGNVRHVPTDLPLRADFNGGVLSIITPFKDVASISSNDVSLTDNWLNADFEAIIFMNPDVLQMDWVLPPTWPFKTIDGAPDPMNYMGELIFRAGGREICDDSTTYDPLHEKGRHFGMLRYAPKPGRIAAGGVLWVKRCPATQNSIYCS